MKRIFISILLFASQAAFGAQLQLNPGDPPQYVNAGTLVVCGSSANQGAHKCILKVDYSEYYRVYTPAGVLYATYDAPWHSDSNRERALAKVAELQSMGTCQGVDIQNGQ